MNARSLCFASMGLACLLVSLQIVARAQLFQDVAPELGLNDIGICAEFFAYDYDNDGDQDLLLARRFGSTLYIYRNDGGTFTQLTDIGLPVDSDGGRPKPMDFDHDGDLDLSLGCYSTFSPLLVFENGHFVDRTEQLGLPLQTGERDYSWVDFDRDGWMDLLRGHSSYGFRLYKNIQGDHFEEVTNQTQLPPFSDFMELAESDVDLDGDIDLFMTRLNHDGHFFRDDGSGVFVDATIVAGLGDADGNDDCAWVDFDHDKYPDLLTQGLNYHAIWHNNGNCTFTEMSVHGTETNDWGGFPHGAQYAIADFDMDGDHDFYVGRPGGCGVEEAPNQFFIQDSLHGLDIWFTDVAAAFSMDFAADCTPHVVDFDSDGDMDLLLAPHNQTVRLYRNNTNSSNYFQVHVLGPEGDQDRWHTRVELYLHGSDQIISASELNYSNVNRNGLNNYFVTLADESYDLRIYFADGTSMLPEDFPSLVNVVPANVDRLLTIYKGEETEWVIPVATPTEFVLESAYPNPFNAVTTLRYNLSQAEQVRAAVYAVDGRWVANLLDGHAAAGEHQLLWNAQRESSGIYFIRVEAGKHVALQKVALLK